MRILLHFIYLPVTSEQGDRGDCLTPKSAIGGTGGQCAVLSARPPPPDLGLLSAPLDFDTVINGLLLLAVFVCLFFVFVFL